MNLNPPHIKYFIILLTLVLATNVAFIKSDIKRDKNHQCFLHALDHAQLDSLSDDFFPTIQDFHFPHYFQSNRGFESDGFDYPVGKPNGYGYYKALNFGDQLHLGEDWNGNGGGNTDLGDPVYSSSHGLVIFAEKVCCGWGNVIRIAHRINDSQDREYIETVYGHLHTVHVNVGDMVLRGEQIGTIGNANGRYSAHLHFELRNYTGMSLGPGYSNDRFGYLDPSEYIFKNRPY